MTLMEKYTKCSKLLLASLNHSIVFVEQRNSTQSHLYVVVIVLFHTPTLYPLELA